MFIYQNSSMKYKITIMVIYIIAFLGLIHSAHANSIPFLRLKSGKMANYGATPWYTNDIMIGAQNLRLALDTGSDFIWVTSDECNTAACNEHFKLNTHTKRFVWLDETPKKHNFGPWGEMEVKSGIIPSSLTSINKLNLPLFLAVEYTGSQFKSLSWDGGLGFPSNSKYIENGSAFYFGNLFNTKKISSPSFSFFTDNKYRMGYLYLGGNDPGKYKPGTAIELQPDKRGPISYLWGTNLYSAKMGNIIMPSLTNACFYLDSGSSLFKGDSIYLLPILKYLYSIKDKAGNNIFEKDLDDDGNWIGLYYKNGGPRDYIELLPDFTLILGQSFKKFKGSASITLSPYQYSYKVTTGDSQLGKWVPAFSVLDGIGGLLVGSTFMDLFYTEFNYVDMGNGELAQGNMYLYQKYTGGPKSVTRVSTPNTIEGSWYNSYCSQVSFSIDSHSKITGIYTSHTGSTGSSIVVGWAGIPKDGEDSNLVYGTPLSLAIQWRLVNKNIKETDPTSHWVSTFSGQYHPLQLIRQKGQKEYLLEPTIEILNGLLATATMKEYTDTAPIMWPETLYFHNAPSSYCKITLPPEPWPPDIEPFDDYITGKWKNEKGDILQIRVMKSGEISGIYLRSDGDKFEVTGLADIINQTVNRDGRVVEQGVALAMRNKEGSVFSMAGGVDLANKEIMNLWTNTITSTTWTNRFASSALNKSIWEKIKE